MTPFRIVLALTLFAPAIYAKDPETYDLRGPAPKVGQVYRTVGKADTLDSKIVLRAGDQTLPTIIADEHTQRTKEYEILKVDGFMATKISTKVIKDENESVAKFGEGGQKFEKESPLVGYKVISELKDESWRSELVGEEPSDEQRVRLAGFAPIDLGHSPIPPGRHAVGKTWVMDASHFKKFLGSDCTSASGELACEFTAIKTVEGVACAVIKSRGTIKAKMKIMGEEMAGTFGVDFLTHRSLKDGVEIHNSGKIEMKISGKQKFDDAVLDMELTGVMKFTDTTELKK